MLCEVRPVKHTQIRFRVRVPGTWCHWGLFFSLGCNNNADMSFSSISGSTDDTTATSDSSTALSITAISPLMGVTTGGSTVTITGTGFDSSTLVCVGVNPVPHDRKYVYTDHPCTLPAATSGTVNISVKFNVKLETYQRLHLRRHCFRFPSSASYSYGQMFMPSTTNRNFNLNYSGSGSITGVSYAFNSTGTRREPSSLFPVPIVRGQ